MHVDNINVIKNLDFMQIHDRGELTLCIGQHIGTSLGFGTPDRIGLRTVY